MTPMTQTLDGSTIARSIAANGTYAVATINLDEAVELLLSSDAPIARVVNGYGDPLSVSGLFSRRLSIGRGAVRGALLVFHDEQMIAVSGVIVGVDATHVQFCDEHLALHTWPIATVFAVIAH